jgi:uncharacterized Zn finger protein
MNIHNKRYMQCPFCSDPLTPTVLMQMRSERTSSYVCPECGFVANFDFDFYKAKDVM